MVNRKGVLCEHPLREHPKQITPQKIRKTLPEYFIISMKTSKIL